MKDKALILIIALLTGCDISNPPQEESSCNNYDLCCEYDLLDGCQFSQGEKSDD